MSAQALLSMLDKVKSTGPNRWTACCPAHDDKHPSLSVRELDDGYVLVNCLAQGCSFQDIISSAGIHISEMFPPEPPPVEGHRPERRPFLPSDVFELARREIAIAQVIACDMHADKQIADEDYARLFVVTERLNRIARAAYGSR